VPLSAETAMTVAHARITRQVRAAYEVTADTLLVKAHGNCSTRYAVDGREAWISRRPSVTVSFLPAGSRVAISMDPAGDQPGPRAASVQSQCGRVSRAGAQDPGRSPPRSSRAGDSGQLRAIQVEARCSELFALVVAAWNTDLGAGRGGKTYSRNAEIMAAARRIPAERFANPPTVRALASELGTNKTKLNELFHEATGITLKTY
jgi:hypothetical protein